MIAPWIIKQIRQREKEQYEERPTLELPVDDYPCEPEKEVVQSNRGVVIIKISGDDDEEEEA